MWQKTNATHGTFKVKIELKKYSTEEDDSMFITQCQQLYELWKKAELINGQKTSVCNIGLEARVAVLEAKTDNSSNESLFLDEKLKDNRNNPELERKGSNTRQSCTDT